MPRLYCLLVVLALSAPSFAGDPPNPNSTECFEKTTCLKRFQDEPTLRIVYKTNLLGEVILPMTADPDYKCVPGYSNSAIGNAVVTGWFKAAKMCAKIWEKTPTGTFKETDRGCGVEEVDLDKKKTCVRPE